MMGILEKLRDGLKKTRDQLRTRLEWAIHGRALDEESFNEIEEALILADCGVKTSSRIVSILKDGWKRGVIKNEDDLRAQLLKILEETLKRVEKPLILNDSKPFVILTLGVNGVGKTTFVAKLGNLFVREGKKILFGACDTFRAAAIEQLEIWAKRMGAEVVKHREGSDPAAVAYDALKASIARGIDVLILDTAGRLHTKTNLMEEMKKIRRVLARESRDAPHETLLILDATTGQNAIQQVKAFSENLSVSGLAISKLDGTAKAGFLFAIAETFDIPIRYVGLGERIEDIAPFSASQFVKGILE